MDDLIRKERRLTAGASNSGAKIHNLPERPRDVEDDGDFHYAVLGPRAASESGKPSAEAQRFINETTGPDRPRVYRNAVLLLAPSKDGVETIRARVRDYLGWEEVKSLPEARDFDDMRRTLLGAHAEEARKRVPDAIVQAYSTVVTVSKDNSVEAFRLAPNGKPTFDLIKEDKRSRIVESAISPEALLPDGPYQLWRPGETTRRASDILSAFAQFPRLPKMIRRKDIEDTLALGVEAGYFVLRLPRPDGSARTHWRVRPGENELRDRDAEIVLPEAAELSEIGSRLLAPGALPGLWPEAGSSLTVVDVVAFFDGAHVIRQAAQGYEETFPVPRAQRAAVEEAINEAVRAGVVWLTSGPASLYREDVPFGVIADTALLRPPPAEIPATAVLPQNLSAAWSNGVATAAALSDALSASAGERLPWTAVRSAIDAAIRARLVERTDDSGPWPCQWSDATNTRLQVVKGVPPIVARPFPLTAEAELTSAELQDLVDALPDILRDGAGLDLHFIVRIQLGGVNQIDAAALARLNERLTQVSGKLIIPDAADHP